MQIVWHWALGLNKIYTIFLGGTSIEHQFFSVFEKHSTRPH